MLRSPLAPTLSALLAATTAKLRARRCHHRKVQAEVPSICKDSDAFFNDTDLWGGDLHPTIAVLEDPTSGSDALIIDTAVPAATPQACCVA